MRPLTLAPLHVLVVGGWLAGCIAGPGGEPIPEDATAPSPRLGGTTPSMPVVVPAGPPVSRLVTGAAADEATVAAPARPGSSPCPCRSVAGTSTGGYGRQGRFLVDASGRLLVLHGVNASNHTKGDPNRVTWHGPADFADLAAVGFDAVRLLVEWAALMPAPGQVDPAYVEAVAIRVDWAAEAGLLVVLDMHQDVFGYGFGGNGAPGWACDAARYAAHEPRSPWFRNYRSPQVRACFDRFYEDDAIFDAFTMAWVALAERLSAHPAVVGFDLLNEPHWGTTDPARFVPDVWQPRQEALAAALRRVAPGKIVFFEGTVLASLGVADPFHPACHPATALAPHYYHPLVHEGFAYDPQWMQPAMVEAFDAIDTMAAALGKCGRSATPVPVLLGEFGAPANTPGVSAYLGDVVEAAARRGWSWTYWSDDRGGGMSLRDATGQFKPALLGPLTWPYARRIPGPVVRQQLDGAGGRYACTFRWTQQAPLELWIGLAGARGEPTQVTLRHHASGQTTTCGQAEGQPQGVWTCPPPPPRRDPTWTLTVAWPRP